MVGTTGYNQNRVYIFVPFCHPVRLSVGVGGGRVWSPCPEEGKWREAYGHSVRGRWVWSLYLWTNSPSLSSFTLPRMNLPRTTCATGRFRTCNMFPKKTGIFRESWPRCLSPIHQDLRFSKFTNGHTCAL